MMNEIGLYILTSVYQHGYSHVVNRREYVDKWDNLPACIEAQSHNFLLHRLFDLTIRVEH